MTGPVVFDAYGTLLDVDAAARAAAGEPGFARLAEIWPRLSADWRAKQLQYTWLRAITGDHRDFWAITEDSLDWALEAAGIEDAALRARLLQLYRRLEAYGDARPLLQKLHGAGVPTAILSNGSPGMLGEAVEAAGLSEFLDHVLSVEAVGIFKPAAQVYDLACETFGVGPGDILFVSSNGWDIAGAAGFGFRALWVNRAGLPVDRLPGRPDHILPDLTTVPDHL